MGKITLIELLADENFNTKYDFLKSEDKITISEKSNLVVNLMTYRTSASKSPVNIKYELYNALDNSDTKIPNLEILPYDCYGVESLKKVIESEKGLVKKISFKQRHNFLEKDYWNFKKPLKDQQAIYDLISIGGLVGAFFSPALVVFPLAFAGIDVSANFLKSEKNNFIKEKQKIVDDYETSKENIQNSKINILQVEGANKLVNAYRDFEIPEKFREFKFTKNHFISLDFVNANLRKIYSDFQENIC